MGVVGDELVVPGPTAFYSKAVGAVLIEGSGTAPRLRPPILLMILLENIARTLPP